LVCLDGDDEVSEGLEFKPPPQKILISYFGFRVDRFWAVKVNPLMSLLQNESLK